MIQLFHNGTVYAGEGAFCEAFAVENGRFIAAGAYSDLAQAYPQAERNDLRGAFVCAGFHDSHMHMLGLGTLLTRVDLSAHTQNLADVIAAMQGGLASVFGDDWLIGRGWNDDYFCDVKRFPTRHDLDAVSRDVPIQITRACGHVCVVNSRALKLAGIDKTTPDPDGGAIDRDENGDPTGVLRENAMGLVSDIQPLPDYKKVKMYLGKAAKALNKLGITSVQSDDFCAFPALAFEAVLRAFSEMESEGALSVRVYEQANLPTIDHLDKFLATGLRTGAGCDRFRIGPVKLLADGSLGAHTAYMARPYADLPETCGIPIYSQHRIDTLIGKAHENGMQVAVHAIGDAAMDQVLNAVEKAQAKHPRPDARHGVVHAQITRPDQLERMQKMDMHAYVQPIFLDYDTRIVEPRAGKELAASSYAFGTLRKTCRASFGSDCPVEGANPLRGIQCAVTRAPINAPHMTYRPEEAVTVAEAIDAFTVNSAYACFAEHTRGRIAPGMEADFVLLESDPFQTYPSRIADIRVKETWVGGEKVYDSSAKEED